MLGQVKFFNYEKGFGFIKAEDGEEYFVHASNVVESDASERKKLSVAWEVEFEIGANERGKCAVDVRVISKGDYEKEN